jgi:chemotaxis signal transduction protein
VTQAVDTTPHTAEYDVAVLALGPDRYVVDLADVAEVGRVPGITRVPGLPAWVAGAANWRGRIVAVLDLRGLLGAPVVPTGPRARLLVLARDGATVGLLVDAVETTMTVDADVASFPASLSGDAAGLVSGQLPRDDGPMAVLDVAGVMRLRDALPRGRRTG